jgi:outer membrane protein, multidrug efflux system
MILWAILPLITACKSLTTEKPINLPLLPESYQLLAGDTFNMATIHWRHYFQDSSLIGLIDIALSENRELMISHLEVQSAKAMADWTRGATLPSLSLQTSFWQRKFGYYTMDDAGNRVTEFVPGDTIPTHLPDYLAGVTTSWELDIWGKLKHQRKSAVARYLAGREGKHLVTSRLISSIAVAYYELLALDNEREILNQTIQKQEEALEMVRFQKETGMAHELAVQQFLSNLLGLKTMALETALRTTELENTLNALLGRFSQPIQRSADVLFEENPTDISGGMPSELLTLRPDIREAEQWVQASKFDVKVARAALFPSVNIGVTAGFQSYSPSFLFTTPESFMYSALGNLIAPVVNRKAIKAQFGWAKTKQLTAIYHYQNTILHAFAEVATGYSNIHKLREMTLLKQQQTEVALNAIETSREFYKNGKVNYVEVLIAQQQALQVQLELVNLNKRRRIASVMLYKALGGGWQ